MTVLVGGHRVEVHRITGGGYLAFLAPPAAPLSSFGHGFNRDDATADLAEKLKRKGGVVTHVPDHPAAVADLPGAGQGGDRDRP